MSLRGGEPGPRRSYLNLSSPTFPATLTSNQCVSNAWALRVTGPNPLAGELYRESSMALERHVDAKDFPQLGEDCQLYSFCNHSGWIPCFSRAGMRCYVAKISQRCGILLSLPSCESRRWWGWGAISALATSCSQIGIAREGNPYKGTYLLKELDRTILLRTFTSNYLKAYI